MSAPTEMLKKASMHHQAGQLEQATKLYRQLLVKNPKHPDLYLRLADVYQRQGKLEEGLACLDKANQLSPGNPQVTFAMACAYHQSRQRDKAIAYYEETLTLDAENGIVRNNMASLLREMGRVDEAISQFQQAVKGHPKPEMVLHNLGSAYFQAKRFEDAEQVYHDVLKTIPDFADAFFGLGRVYQERGQVEEALAAFEKAAELAPQNAAYAYQLGLVAKRQSRFDDAIRHFERAVELLPNYPEAHMGLAMVHFMQSDFQKAWPEYEWRLRLAGHKGIQLTSQKPVWRGEPLEGKTLLVHMEQGFGDAMQFVRFLYQVKAMNPAKIIMITADELRRLFMQSNLPVDEYIGPGGGKLPNFDYHTPLLSIPYALNLKLEDVGMTDAYLSTISGMIAMWSHQIPRTSRKQVGLVWTGRPTHPYNKQRSVPLELFADLTATPGTRWVNLQKDSPKPDLPGEWFEVYTQTTDFADTAAMIHGLDLVITIDTSVAHLAGAMGKPTWVLLDTEADWRWFRDRDDSPWYPSVRVFRQKTAGDWASVITEVKEALQAETSK